MYKSYITDVGAKKLAALNGLETSISRVSAGSGSIEADEIYDLTDLTEYVCDLSIVDVSKTDNVLTVTARIESADIETGFYVKQIGVFLNINNDEVLFQVSRANDGYEGDYIPSKDEAEDFFAEYCLNISINDSQNITAVVDMTRYAKKDELESYALKTYVDEAVEGYALKTYVDEELESYALKTYVDEELESYALKEDLPPRTANIVIAASDSGESLKKYADYVCSGESDQTTINTAIDSLGETGGKIVLLGGTYECDGIIYLKYPITFCGVGAATVINTSSYFYIYSDYGIISDMTINCTYESDTKGTFFFDGTSTYGFSRYVTFHTLAISSAGYLFCDSVGGSASDSSTGGACTKMYNCVVSFTGENYTGNNVTSSFKNNYVEWGNIEI